MCCCSVHKRQVRFSVPNFNKCVMQKISGKNKKCEKVRSVLASVFNSLKFTQKFCSQQSDVINYHNKQNCVLVEYSKKLLYLHTYIAFICTCTDFLLDGKLRTQVG